MQRIYQLIIRPFYVYVFRGIIGRVLNLQKRFLLANHDKPEDRKLEDRKLEDCELDMLPKHSGPRVSRGTK